MPADAEPKPIQGKPIWLSEDGLKRRIKEDRLRSKIGKIEIAKNISLNIGTKTALITVTDEKEARNIYILLEIVWEKKHWWSFYHPILKNA